MHEHPSSGDPGDESDERDEQRGGGGQHAEAHRIPAGDFSQGRTDHERNCRSDRNSCLTRTAKDPEDQGRQTNRRTDRLVEASWQETRRLMLREANRRRA